jgi:predicted ATPase
MTDPKGNVAVDLRTEEEKKAGMGKSKIYHVKVSIRQPVDMLVPGKGQMWVSVNGTPGSGKTTLARQLENYVAFKCWELQCTTPPPIVIQDTDELFYAFWRSVGNVRRYTHEQFAKLWFANLHTELSAFFDRQPPGALIICCGVADYTVEEETGHMSYWLPNIQWSRKYFLQISDQQLVEQRYDRDLKSVVDSPEGRRRLTSTESNEDEEISFSKWKIRMEHAIDQQVYVQTLGFVPLYHDELFKELTSLVQFWLPRPPSFAINIASVYANTLVSNRWVTRKRKANGKADAPMVYTPSETRPVLGLSTGEAKPVLGLSSDPAKPMLDLSTGQANPVRNGTERVPVFLPKTFEWAKHPDRQTIEAAYGTLALVQASGNYPDIAPMLAHWNRKDFERAVAESKVTPWTIQEVLERRVVNQPLDHVIRSLDEIKGFWEAANWDNDVADFQRLYQANQLVPVIFVKLPDGRYFNLDGAHRTALCCLTGNDVYVCAIKR